MDAKHTPGPWKPTRSHEDFDGPMWDIDPEEAGEYAANPFRGIQAASRSVVSAHDCFEFHAPDAHLIAAAPDLLEIVQYLHNALTGDGISIKIARNSPLAAMISAAIAKATGTEVLS